MAQNIKEFSLSELEILFKNLSLEPYRGRQIFQWLWQKGVDDFNMMTNLSLNLRRLLSERFTIEDIKLVKKIKSPDGAEKFLWELKDKNLIESVFIPEQARKTVCISTQVGCPLGCLFCATGLVGFKRDLKWGEIANQVQMVQKTITERLTNIVLMGMGEPLLNTDNLFLALEIITSPIGFGISQRHITISTAGVIEGIERILNSKWKVKLAISLNFADEELRKEYMPITKKNPLKEILKLARLYSEKKDLVTFEYVLIKNLNDSQESAYQLLKLLKGIPSKINLIPYNPYPQLPYESPEPDTIVKFQEILFKSDHPVTLRKSKGKEILAGCGQLAGKEDYS